MDNISNTPPATPETQAPVEAANSIKTIVPFAICVCADADFNKAVEMGFSEIYVPRAGGSYMKHQKLSHGRHARMIVPATQVPAPVKAADLAFSPPIEQEVNFLPAGKVPVSFLHQIAKFFREVMDKYKTNYEAQAFILWNPERGYHISIPDQSVSQATVNFEYTPECIPAGSVLVVDIHSH